MRLLRSDVSGEGTAVKRRCPTPDCGRPSRPGRRICWCCSKRRYRAAHPVRDAFHAHRHHARERGIPTFLEFVEFEQFCLVTGYHQFKGNADESLTIDRPDADQPYMVHNINAKTRTENSRKWWEYDRPRRMQRRAA